MAGNMNTSVLGNWKKYVTVEFKGSDFQPVTKEDVVPLLNRLMGRGKHGLGFMQQLEDELGVVFDVPEEVSERIMDSYVSVIGNRVQVRVIHNQSELPPLKEGTMEEGKMYELLNAPRFKGWRSDDRFSGQSGRTGRTGRSVGRQWSNDKQSGFGFGRNNKAKLRSSW